MNQNLNPNPILNLPPTKIIFDEQTGQHITFTIDKAKTEFYLTSYLPKWIPNKNKFYYLVSQKLWGIHQQRLLYVDEFATDFVIQYYH